MIIVILNNISLIEEDEEVPSSTLASSNPRKSRNLSVPGLWVKAWQDLPQGRHIRWIVTWGVTKSHEKPRCVVHRILWKGWGEVRAQVLSLFMFVKNMFSLPDFYRFLWLFKRMQEFQSIHTSFFFGFQYWAHWAPAPLYWSMKAKEAAKDGICGANLTFFDLDARQLLYPLVMSK